MRIHREMAEKRCHEKVVNQIIISDEIARRVALEREVHEPLEQERQKHNNPVKRSLEQHWLYQRSPIVDQTGDDAAWPDLDSRTGFRHREWQKCWRLIEPGQKCGAQI